MGLETERALPESINRDLSESDALFSIWLSTMSRLGLSPISKLGTLFQVRFNEGSKEEMKEIKALVSLVKSAFIIWPGAVQGSSKSAVSGVTFL